jgi:SAM-dependent methyltransferase
MIEYYKSSTAYGDFLRETDSSEYLIYVGMFERFVLPADGPILDIGCGTGASTMLLRKRGLDAVGTDVSERFLPHGLSGFMAIDFLDAREIASGSYAAAGCHDVIEHVESPRRFLTEIVRVVKPGGHVVICAPNLTSPMVAARVVLDVLQERTPYLGITSLGAALKLLLASPYYCLRAALGADAFRMRPPALHTGIIGYDADAIYWANPAEIRRFLEAQGCDILWYQRQGRSVAARLIAKYAPSFAGQICIVARKREQ